MMETKQPTKGNGHNKHTFPDEWRRGVYEAIERRRDMRSFLPDPVPGEILGRVLHAANQAPSVGFMQPWDFIIVESLDTRTKLQAHVEQERKAAAATFSDDKRERYLSFKLEGILDAPVNICVTCDTTRFGPAVIGRNTIREMDVYSAVCAVQNLWLSARAEGLGVGWVSILQPEKLRELLEIPDHVIPVAYLCVGWVDEFPEKPLLQTVNWLPKRTVEETLHAETWLGKPDETYLRQFMLT